MLKGKLQIISILALGLIMGLAACQKEIKSPPEPRPPVPQAPRPQEPPLPPPATWADYDLAVRLHLAGDHQEAGYLLRRISKLDLDDRQRRQLNFLAGINAYNWKRYEQADQYLNLEDSVPAALEGYALYYSGLAAFKTGNYAAARKLLGRYIEHQPEGLLVDRARLTKAETLIKMGQTQAALAEAQSMVKSSQEARARLLMARAYESSGQTALARDTYRMSMEKSRTQDPRAEAAQKYRELISPVLLEDGQEELKLTFVRFLRREWRLDEVVSTCEQIIKNGGPVNFINTIADERAQALFYSGNIEPALAYFIEKKAQSSYAAYMYARALKRASRLQEAAPAFLTAAKLHPRRAKTCKFEAGSAYLKLDQLSKAENAFAGLNGKYKDDKIWLLAFYHYRHKSWQKAADKFKIILDKYPKSKLARGARYWRACCLENLGRREEARKVFSTLAASRKDYYYRLLAEQRLGLILTKEAWDNWEDLPQFQRLLEDKRFFGLTAWAYSDPGLGLGDLLTEGKKVAVLDKPPRAPVKVAESLTRLKDLAASGVFHLAHLEAEQIRRLLKGKPGQADLRLRVFALSSAFLAEDRQYDDFVRLQYTKFRTLLSGRSEDEKLIARRRFFPLAYPEAIWEAAREFDLHPAFILSVMRTESYYQPDILSAANAQGLMQILPSTGRKIAARLGLPPPAYDALFNPQTNIRFGAWYLRALIDEFNGQLPLALASYNAGPFNVKSWIQQAGDISLAEFIETIPFDQTRIYVKKILGIFYQYRLLYSGLAQIPSLDAPLNKEFLHKINF